MPVADDQINYSADFVARTDRGAFVEDCPRCGSDNVWPEVAICLEDPFGIYCANCNWGGPKVVADEVDEAVLAWNHEARQIRAAKTLGLAVNFDQSDQLKDQDQC